MSTTFALGSLAYQTESKYFSLQPCLLHASLDPLTGLQVRKTDPPDLYPGRAGRHVFEHVLSRFKAFYSLSRGPTTAPFSPPFSLHPPLLSATGLPRDCTHHLFDTGAGSIQVTGGSSFSFLQAGSRPWVTVHTVSERLGIDVSVAFLQQWQLVPRKRIGSHVLTDRI